MLNSAGCLQRPCTTVLCPGVDLLQRGFNTLRRPYHSIVSVYTHQCTWVVHTPTHDCPQTDTHLEQRLCAMHHSVLTPCPVNCINPSVISDTPICLFRLTECANSYYHYVPIISISYCKLICHVIDTLTKCIFFTTCTATKVSTCYWSRLRSECKRKWSHRKNRASFFFLILILICLLLHKGWNLQWLDF